MDAGCLPLKRPPGMMIFPALALTFRVLGNPNRFLSLRVSLGGSGEGSGSGSGGGGDAAGDGTDDRELIDDGEPGFDTVKSGVSISSKS